MKITIKSFWPAIAWSILSTVAFFIPGKALPGNDWLGKIHFDKFVHIGIFSVMIILWCLPLLHRTTQKPIPKLVALISMAFFSYGVLVELMQHFFVSNRSFDIGDIGADAVGCLIGFLYMRNQWKR